MRPFVMQARRQAYWEVLPQRLLAIRDCAYEGNVKPCAAEADHLHNLPSVFHEANELRHHCCIRQERSRSLRRLESLGEREYVERRQQLHADPWRVLASIALDEESRGYQAP